MKRAKIESNTCKDLYLHVRVSEEEAQEIKAKADALRLTVSAYVRMMLLGGAINDRA